jgi:hypothetical protein
VASSEQLPIPADQSKQKRSLSEREDYSSRRIVRELLHEFEGNRFNAFDEEGIPGVTGVVGRGRESGLRRSDPICNLDQSRTEAADLGQARGCVRRRLNGAVDPGGGRVGGQRHPGIAC